jgi:glucose/arabinose dehydrogenase
MDTLQQRSPSDLVPSTPTPDATATAVDARGGPLAAPLGLCFVFGSGLPRTFREVCFKYCSQLEFEVQAAL